MVTTPTSRLRGFASMTAGLIFLLVPPSPARGAAVEPPLAPDLAGLGTLHFQVSTSSPRAQQLFDQGLRLLYAFDDREALRTFLEAAHVDPTLAMAHWGQAMALGPNLRFQLTAEREHRAYEAARRASATSAGASDRERGLIEAMQARFAESPTPRAVLDRAYEAAMKRLAERYPDDPDIQTLYIDALMNTMDGNYWEENGEPKLDTGTIVATLEQVIALRPYHIGAHAYYTHLMERSSEPDRAAASAEWLGAMEPSSGLTVHFAAHIYMRVGRYRDAIDAIERSIAADEYYIAQCRAQGLEPVTSGAENFHLLWAASTLEGRHAIAVPAALEVRTRAPRQPGLSLAQNDLYRVTPLLAYSRFNMWREVLAEPRPPAQNIFALGIWHYARSLAFVAHNDFPHAEAELAALKGLIVSPDFKSTAANSLLRANLEIAWRIADAERASKVGATDEAIHVLEEAVRVYDALPYSEPAAWHQPPRQVLGAILLEAGRAEQAETVYRQDLKQLPENGWSLFGLWQSLDAQGRRNQEAVDVRQRFENAWVHADVDLTSSRSVDVEGEAQAPRSSVVTLRPTN
jgi:tetratricopeptide (TPR) repeat protein